MRTTQFFLVAAFILCNISLFSQGVGINDSGNSPHSTAGLDVDFNDRGILIPRLTEAERDAIANPAFGLQIFNLDTECLNFYLNGWRELCPTCIQAPPVAAGNTPLCEGETLNLSASFVSGGTYSWTGPGGFSSSQQNPVISNATPLNSGIYSVTVTVNGCTSSASNVNVLVNAEPEAPNPSSNSPVCEGASLNLSASAVAGVYTWSGPNGFSSSLQNPTISNVTAAAAGTYYLTATIDDCVSQQNSTVVVVNPASGSGSQVFSYTGSVQTWQVPQCVSSITAEALGASGGGNATVGKGGRAVATIPVTGGETLNIYVGGQGTQCNSCSTGGYNGGGGTSGSAGVGTGGGASDVRRGTSLANRLIVAAGGGGGGDNRYGGYGGGLTGQAGEAWCCGWDGGSGGTQSAGGAGSGTCSPILPTAGTFGEGGKGQGNSGGGGGGGGGWYGGGGGCIGGGGGGSSYVDAAGNTNKSTQGNFQTGNGQVTISW